MFDKPWQANPSAAGSAPQISIGARELIDAAPDLIFCCDADGRFQWLNAAAETLLGHRAADLLGGSFLSIVDASDRDRVVRHFLRQRRHAREVSERALRLVAGDGAVHGFEARVRRVVRPDGDVVFVGSARPSREGPAASVADVTGQAVISEFAGPFASGDPAPHGPVAVPHDAQTPILGDDLRRRLAEACSEAELRSEFLTTMGQEIRTPVNGMLGITQLLLESELDPDQRSFVEVIECSARALLNLVNDTLEFSKLEEDSLDVQRIAFDLRHTVDEVAALIAPLANEKGLGFDCRVHHEVPSLLVGDPSRIRQVLCNIATTLLRFTDRGELGIVVERVHEDDAKVLLRLSIVDTGLSLENPDLADVVTAFKEGDTQAARQQGGAGLALALSRRIVEIMGGEVGTSTDRDGGSRFWLRLPVDKQSAARQGVVAADNVPLRDLRVLVVDPSRVNREETLAMLAAWGCRAAGVPTHTEALAVLRDAAQVNDPFRLALIEMQLPDVDGQGLGRIIRDDPSLSDTRLMLLTGVGSRGDADRVHEIGFAAYLVRPISWSHLYDATLGVMGQESHGLATDLVTRHSVAEARRNRVRILLVEDNEVNRLVAESVLQRLGFTVEKASNGRQALERMDHEQFDLILMDLQMPEVDGYRATAALRARERGRQRTPVIAMTSTATPAERARCVEAGMDDYLAKPLDLGLLTTVVERWTRAEAESAPKTSVEPAAAHDRAELTLDAVRPLGGDSHGHAHDDEPVLDVARLEESCMGIPALRETLLQAFLQDVEPRLARLKECVASGEPRRIEFEAHGLKGMCATVGAARCRRVFEAMEDHARECRLEEMDQMLARGEDEVRLTLEHIDRLDRAGRDAA